MPWNLMDTLYMQPSVSKKDGGSTFYRTVVKCTAKYHVNLTQRECKKVKKMYET